MADEPPGRSIFKSLQRRDRSPEAGPLLGVTGSVMISPSILNPISRTVSPAQFEAYEWRLPRAVVLLWIAAVSLVATPTLWLVAPHVRSFSLRYLISVVPISIHLIAISFFALFRKRAHRISTSRVERSPEAWRVLYSFRGYFGRIRRRRDFESESAAHSFLLD